MNTSRTLSVGLALALSIACSSRPPSTVEDTPSAQENAPEQNEDTQPDLVQEDLPEEDLGKPPRQVPPPTTVSAPGRIVAIGDVHGDLQAARGALMLAGAMDDNDNWIGGDLVVVQVGDQPDRGEGE